MSELSRQARLWVQKWRWYQRNELPWNRARIHGHLLRRESFARWPLHGNVLEAFAEGSPETVARSRKSYTGHALRAVLEPRRQRRSA